MQVTTVGRHTGQEREGPHWSTVALVSAALFLVFELDRRTGSAPIQHLYYVPILVAAIRFELRGGVMAALGGCRSLSRRQRPSPDVQIRGIGHCPDRAIPGDWRRDGEAHRRRSPPARARDDRRSDRIAQPALVRAVSERDHATRS
jgi:hypothetical protein